MMNQWGDLQVVLSVVGPRDHRAGSVNTKSGV